MSSISEANKFEKEDKLSESLFVLLKLKNIYQDKISIVNVINQNIERIINKSVNKSLNTEMNIRSLYLTDSTPENYKISIDDSPLKPVVSFTSISSRINRVEKTVKSILNQTVKPQSINLYISSGPYLIDEGIEKKSEILKIIFDLGVNIYFTKNIGPYRKQYPVIEQLRRFHAPNNTPIITIDDDVIYPKNIFENLLKDFDVNNAVVAHRGREITISNTNKKIDKYKNFIIPTKKTSLSNIGTGKNGIAYKLGYFPVDKKYFVGHILAPTADDLWCKMISGLYCIPTTILEPKAAYDSRLDFPESDPKDKKSLFHNYNAKGKNDYALNSLEEYFSVLNKTSLFEILQ